jgi:hypothetical protein
VDPATSVLLQYGAVGAIALIALIGVRIMFGKLTEQMEREKERGDRLEQELLKLNEAVRGEYLNTISRASQAITEATRAVADSLAAARRG